MKLNVPLLQQEHEYSCLAAAARMALLHLGIDETEERLCRLLKVRPHGAHALNLAHLQELGAYVRFAAADLPQIRALLAQGIAPIVPLNPVELPYWTAGQPLLHAVVVVGADDDQLLLNDPYFGDGPRQVAAADFDRAWALSGRLLIAITRQMPPPGQ